MISSRETKPHFLDDAPVHGMVPNNLVIAVSDRLHEPEAREGDVCGPQVFFGRER